MSRRDWTMTIDLAVRQWAPRVTEAALGFERRWTRRALRVHSSKLADAFETALTDYGNATDAGSASDITRTGERLCRAYVAITKELATANVPDDAYMVGRAGGLVIAISATPEAGERAREIEPTAVHYTPHEIAALIDLDQRAQKVTAVKRAFPGAEMGEIKENRQ